MSLTHEGWDVPMDRAVDDAPTPGFKRYRMQLHTGPHHVYAYLCDSHEGRVGRRYRDDDNSGEIILMSRSDVSAEEARTYASPGCDACRGFCSITEAP